MSCLSRCALGADRRKFRGLDSTADNKALLGEVQSLIDTLDHDMNWGFKRLESLSIGQKDTELLKQIVNIISDKAIKNPVSGHLYAEICKRQVDSELRLAKGSSSRFCDVLLNHAQTIFAVCLENLRVRWEKVVFMEGQTIWEIKNLLHYEIEQSDFELRRRSFGISTFVAHLCNCQLIPTLIGRRCLYDFMRTSHPTADVYPEPPYDEISLQCAVRMMTIMGKLEKNENRDGREFVDCILKNLAKISHKCSQALSFMITNLIELRENHWVEKEERRPAPPSPKQKRKRADQEQNTLGSMAHPSVVEELQKVVAERNQLLKEKEHAVAKYETARERARSKSEDLETVTRELAQLKENHRAEQDRVRDVAIGKVRELLQDNDRVQAKYDESMETLRSKNDELDTVTRELAQLKEEFAAVQKNIQEKSVTEKEGQSLDAESDWHSTDEIHLTTEWEKFHSNFNTLHKNIKDLLQQSCSAKHASVLSTNLDKVRNYTQLAESVRDQLLKDVGECTKKIEGVLSPAASDASITVKREPVDIQVVD